MEELKAQDVPITPASSLPEFLPFRVTQVAFTGQELMPDAVHHWLHHGIYCGLISTIDLINFWNLRASGIQLIFVPLDSYDRLMTYARRYVGSLAEWARQDQRGWRRLGLWSRPGQTIPTVVTDIFPRDVQTALVELDEALWNGLSIRPPVYGLDARSVLANLDIRPDAKPSIELALPREIDLADLPVEQASHQWIVSAKPVTEFGYEGHTLNLPFLPDLNDWYARRVVFVPGELRVEVESLGKISELSDETLHLTPVPGTDIIYRVLERANIVATPSHAGRIAQQLIQQMGGLEGSRVFKIRGVRKLIASDAAHAGVTRGRATEIIHDLNPESGQPSFSKFESLSIESPLKPPLTTSGVFNYLLGKGILRPGLQLECPRCTLDFRIEMPVSETCKCEFCGHSFIIAPYLKDRGDWRFRLTGLFGRKGGDEGTIPVALALLQVLRQRRDFGSTFLYTCGTDLEYDGLKCESDLIVIERHREGTSVLLGECKGSLEIDDQDIANLENVCARIRPSGVGCYLLFAKTADTFSPQEIDKLRGLAERGVSMILFTARELEPPVPYDWLPNREQLPARYARDFEGLARNSSWLYLSP